MKNVLLILPLLALLSFNSWSCSCSSYPLSHDQIIKETIRNEYGRRMTFDMNKDVEAIKAYPTMIERMDLFGFRGTSCEVRGPQDEFMYYCINKVKFDYLVKLPNCEVVINVMSTYKKIKAKIVKSNCKN